MVPTIHQAGTNIRSEEHLESLTLTIFRSNLFKNQWQQASVQGQTKKIIMRKNKMLQFLISHIVVEFVNLMTPSILYIVNVNNVNEYI